MATRFSSGISSLRVRQRQLRSRLKHLKQMELEAQREQLRLANKLCKGKLGIRTSEVKLGAVKQLLKQIKTEGRQKYRELQLVNVRIEEFESKQKQKSRFNIGISVLLVLALVAMPLLLSGLFGLGDSLGNTGMDLTGALIGTGVEEVESVERDSGPVSITAAPVVDTIIVNSTSGTNTTFENLTATATISGGDGSVKTIYNWEVENNSITVINMPFEGGSDNNSTKDYSSYPHNISDYTGTPVWNSTGGHDGRGAYELDGESYFEIGADATHNVFEELSISMWFKPAVDYDSSLDDHIVLLTRQEGFVDSYWLSINADGKLQAGSNGGSIQSTKETWNKGEWYHIVTTYRDTNGIYSGEIYINGLLEPLSVDNYDDMSGGNTTIRIGDGTNDDPYNGTVDELMVFNRSLTADQAVSLYENMTNTIVSQETFFGEDWSICATANDGLVDGTTVCTAELQIQENNAPVVNTFTLNSTDGSNDTNNNLSSSVNITDQDNDQIQVVYDWRNNGTSRYLLNAPVLGGNTSYGVNMSDYSTHGNNGTLEGVTINLTAGFDGGAAYEFDGVNDYIDMDFGLSANTHFDKEVLERTYAMHVYPYNTGPLQVLFEEGGTGDGLNLYINGSHVYSGAWDSDELFLSSPINESEWQHVTYVYRSKGTTELYLNGILVNSSESISNSGGHTGNDAFGAMHDSSNFHTGSDSGNDYYYSGLMDNIVIINSSITPEEIALLASNVTKDNFSNSFTDLNDTWSVCVTGNDGFDNGQETCSEDILITSGQNVPVIDVINITATDPLNKSTENISISVETSDIELDPIKVIHNWEKSNSSVIILNMPVVNTSHAYETAVDYSGYGNDGYLNGTNFNLTAGFDGGAAYEFDGTGSYMCLDEGACDGTGINEYFDSSIDERAISFYFNSYNNSERHMIFEEGGAAAGMNVYISNNTIYTGVWGGTGDFISYPITESTWHHAVIIYDNAEDIFELYLDGVLVNSTTTTKVVGAHSSDDAIGAVYDDTEFHDGDFTGDGYYYQGLLDQITIYNISFGQEQVTALYENRTDFIHNETTAVGDEWRACSTPNDGKENGLSVCSNSIDIGPENYLPVVNDFSISSPGSLNSSFNNLTASYTLADAEGDIVNSTTTWYLRNESRTIINMPIMNYSNVDSETRDYSGGFINGSISDITFNLTGGFDGGAAYEFDGVNDYASFSAYSIFDSAFDGGRTYSMHIYPYDTASEQVLFEEGGTSHGLNLFMSNGHIRGGAWSTSWGTIFLSYPITEGQWQHVSFVFDDNDDCELYVDGVLVNSTSGLGTISSHTGGDQLGRSDSSKNESGNLGTGYYYKGLMDNIMIHNNSLGPEQVKVLSEGKSEILASNETNIGDSWHACVTANDRIEDSVEICTDGVVITDQVFVPEEPADDNYLVPTHVSPTNASTTTNRTTAFIWNNTNLTGDVNYTFVLATDEAFTTEIVNVSTIPETSINTSFSPVNDLNFTTYYWKVQGYNATDTGNWSTITQFDVISLVSVSLPVSALDFGNVAPGISVNSTDGAFNALEIRNDGNVPTDIDVNATDIFTNMASETPGNYSFMIAEKGAGAYSSALTTWTNLSSIESRAITELYHINGSNGANDAYCHILVTAPSEETSGAKTSSITITGVMS